MTTTEQLADRLENIMGVLRPEYYSSDGFFQALDEGRAIALALRALPDTEALNREIDKRSQDLLSLQPGWDNEGAPAISEPEIVLPAPSPHSRKQSQRRRKE